MNNERKTPKRYFIEKLYAALCEFEDTTGAEIHSIRIVNRRKEELGSEGKLFLGCDFELEMK